jgi:hypothetical protein
MCCSITPPARQLALAGQARAAEAGAKRVGKLFGLGEIGLGAGRRASRRRSA